MTYRNPEPYSGMYLNDNTNPNESEYLHTILRPFDGPANIPDYNMTTSHPKAVELNVNILVAGSGSVLFVYLPHSLYNPIKMFVYVNSASRYFYVQDLPYDQQIAQNYTFARFVSGGVRLISATVTGTNFNVAGTITAVAVQQLPDVQFTLSYPTLTSYKRNDRDVVAAVPVESGVTVIAQPNGNNDFEVLNTQQTLTQHGMIRAQTYAIPPTGPPTAYPGWFTALPVVGGPATIILFDSANAPGYVAPNLGWGKVTIRAHLALKTTTADNYIFNLTVLGRTVSAVDWTTVTVVSSIDQRIVTVPAGGANAIVDLMCEWDLGVPIDDIALQVTSSTVGALTFANYIINSGIVYEAREYYEDGINQPAYVIGMQQLGVGQTIAISGCGNYEVVPDASLAKDITTNYFGPFEPLEMHLVTHYIANAYRNGLRFVWACKDYQQWCIQNGHLKHTDMQHISTATGFTDFVMKALRWAKPFVQAGLPLLGSALLGPSGGALGGALGNVLGEFVPEESERSASFAYRPMTSASYSYNK